MKQSTNYIIQFLALIAQGANLFANIWPAPAQRYVALGVFLLQGASAIIAHNYNPDGTTARAAYVPGKSTSQVSQMLLLTFLLTLSLVSFGCGKQDVARGLRIGAGFVEVALDVFSTEQQNGGLIEEDCADCPTVNDQGQQLKAIINQVADFVIAHADDFSSADKDALLALIDDGLVRTRSLAASGQLFTNPKKRDKFVKVISLVEAALKEARQIVASSKPKPQPTPMKIIWVKTDAADLLLRVPSPTLYEQVRAR